MNEEMGALTRHALFGREIDVFLNGRPACA
jgi:hypothetical protein